MRTDIRSKYARNCANSRCKVVDSVRDATSAPRRYVISWSSMRCACLVSSSISERRFASVLNSMCGSICARSRRNCDSAARRCASARAATSRASLVPCQGEVQDDHRRQNGRQVRHHARLTPVEDADGLGEPGQPDHAADGIAGRDRDHRGQHQGADSAEPLHGWMEPEQRVRAHDRETDAFRKQQVASEPPQAGYGHRQDDPDDPRNTGSIASVARRFHAGRVEDGTTGGLNGS